MGWFLANFKGRVGMNKIYRLLAVVGAMAWGISSPAFTAQTLDNAAVTARYEFSWGGISFGKIALSADETDSTYAMRTLIKSKGLASIFVKHTSDTKMDGTKSGATYLPQNYDANFQTRNKKKHINLKYDGAGNISREISEPVDTDRPKVSDKERAGAHDPLSLVFDIRRKLFDALAASSKTFNVNMYDGRRLTKVQIDVVDIVKRTVAGEAQNLVHVIATRAPLSGYTDKELARMKNGVNSMHIYFSDDANLWPLLMEVEVYFATLRGEFTKACDKIEECF